MSETLRIGGAPAAVLSAAAPGDAPAFVGAIVAPARGMMLLQASLRLPSGEIVEALAAPDPAEAARVMDGGPDDFAGNKSFSFGGAILAPFANRIRGRALAGAREILADVAGHQVRLPRNWGGKAPGAEQYAMHGLILDAPFTPNQTGTERVAGHFDAGDFAGRWPGRLRLDVTWSLEAGALRLAVTAANTGDEATPVGLGWHPYFRLHSGDRRQAALWLGASARALVNDYDEVLPTGRVEDIAGGPYDFTAVGGRPLADLYLDDCFTDLMARPILAELRDPAAGVGLRLSSTSEAVQALQVYAPPDQAFVVIEPQFNLADPFGSEWRGRDTGMRRLEPGQSVAYEVRVEPFALDEPAA
jgi:galactose mutarotase-like enzyme